MNDPDDIQTVLDSQEAEHALRTRLIQVGVCLDFVEQRAKSLAESLGIPVLDAARIATSILLGEHF